MTSPFERAGSVREMDLRKDCTGLALSMLSLYAGELLLEGRLFRQLVYGDPEDEASSAHAILYFRNGQPELPEDFDQTTRTLFIDYMNPKKPSTKTALCEARLIVGPASENPEAQLNTYELLNNSRTQKFPLYEGKPFLVPGYRADTLGVVIADGIDALWTL